MEPSSPARDHVETNRAMWERTHEAYDRRHRDALGGRRSRAWGFWRIPEEELRLLGEVRDRDVLELGCGAARWSIGLASEGARAVGIDFSAGQLRLAGDLARHAARRPDFVRANGERIPFADRSFDIVFCDWGALTFCDPYRAIPECARVLRKDGVLAFASASPLRELFYNRRTGRLGRRLANDYFGMHRIDYPDEVNFQLPYGEWIRLFVESGLQVEALLETHPPPATTSTYLNLREAAWAEHWPMECLWKLRKT